MQQWILVTKNSIYANFVTNAHVCTSLLEW